MVGTNGEVKDTSGSVTVLILLLLISKKQHKTMLEKKSKCNFIFMAFLHLL